MFSEDSAKTHHLQPIYLEVSRQRIGRLIILATQDVIPEALPPLRSPPDKRRFCPQRQIQIEKKRQGKKDDELEQSFWLAKQGGFLHRHQKKKGRDHHEEGMMVGQAKTSEKNSDKKNFSLVGPIPFEQKPKEKRPEKKIERVDLGRKGLVPKIPRDGE